MAVVEAVVRVERALLVLTQRMVGIEVRRLFDLRRVVRNRDATRPRGRLRERDDRLAHPEQSGAHADELRLAGRLVDQHVVHLSELAAVVATPCCPIRSCGFWAATLPPRLCCGRCPGHMPEPPTRHRALMPQRV